MGFEAGGGECSDEGRHFHGRFVDHFNGAGGQVGAGGMDAFDLAEGAFDFSHTPGAVHGGDGQYRVDWRCYFGLFQCDDAHSTSPIVRHALPCASTVMRKRQRPDSKGAA